MHINSEESIRKHLATSRKKAAMAVLFSCIFTGTFLFIVSNHFSSKITTTRQIHLHQRVDLALDFIAPILQKIHEGQITQDVGLKMALPIIRRLTYEDENGSNYFFIITYNGILLLQPFEPYMENVDLESQEYNVHRKTIQSILTAAKKSPKGAFVRYAYNHPNTSGQIQKESFVINIPELGVLLGSGNYISDIFPSAEQLLLLSGSIIVLLVIIFPFFLCMKKSNSQIRLLSETIQTLQIQENTLKDTSYKYHTILDNSLEGIIILKNFTIQLANNAFCSLTGYSMEELSHLDLTTFLYHEDAELIKNRLRRQNMGEHVPSQNTFRLLDKNGSTHWMLANTTSIIWQNEPASLSMLFDITSQRGALEELQAEQSRFRYFMEHAPFPIAIFSQDGFLKHVNKQCISMWKLEHTVLVDSYNIFTDPQLQHEPIRSQIKRAFTGEVITTAPISYQSNNPLSGVVHTIQFRLYPAFHGDGKLKDVILVHENLAEKADN